jgi:hypothetical protein
MLTDYQLKIQSYYGDDANDVSEEQRDTAIADAVIRYSKDRPRAKVEDVTCVEGGNYLPLPSAWEPDFSELKTLEFPLAKFPPCFINAYSLYPTPTGLQIMVSDALPMGAIVRMSYSISHVLDLSTDTVPLGDREAVVCLAAANICDQLAALYSGDTDSTIQADSVNHQTKAGEFASRAKALRKRYLDELGIDAKKNVAAGSVVSFPSNTSQGRPNLTHRKGWR